MRKMTLSLNEPAAAYIESRAKREDISPSEALRNILRDVMAEDTSYADILEGPPANETPEEEAYRRRDEPPWLRCAKESK